MVQIQHPYTHTLLTAMHPALLSLERKKRLYKQTINTAHLYNGSTWKVLRTARSMPTKFYYHYSIRAD